MKVYLWPFFSEEDKGDGGVRRVVEAQRKYLPEQGIEIVDDPEQADVLACHISAPSNILTRFPDKPLVAHCHGLYWSEYDWSEWAIRANKDVMDLIRVADFVTAPSEWVAQTIRRHTLRKTETVYHGIDTEAWIPGENKGYVLWNKTRIDPVCDPEPMQKVAEKLPDVAFISTYGRETENVQIIGRHAHTRSMQLVQEAGIYLSTARETFGIGTLEAMACGVPIVGFDWGGNSEIVTHKVHGWLARPGDIDGLAEGIEFCLAHRKEIGIAARRRAQFFTWSNAATKYAGIYRSIGSRNEEKAGTNRRPKVSVIVTAYNLEKYLDACLSSVAESTLPDFECIVVDDRSPDDCGEISDRWAARDSRFRVIHNDENAYLAGARNIGIQAAKGRYILPLDADDRIAPNTLEVLSEALDRDRGIHIAYGNVLFCEEDGKEWHSGWPVEYNFDWHIYKERNLLPYCSMFRREVWEQTGGYRTRLKTGEDADFWMRAASYGFRPRMVTTADTLLYTNREGSMSHVNTERLWPSWYPWVKNADVTPAGACTQNQLPVSSLDPQVVDVIIPCGPGHEKYVMDAIDSVDAQTFRYFSCTVINDTGKDFSFPIPPWVKVLGPFGERMGPARSRNIGIYESKSPLFLPLDADDYLQPHALAVMYNAWREHKSIIYGDFFEDPYEEGKFQIFRNKDFSLDHLMKYCMYQVTALTPKKFWEEAGGYDEKLEAWEDWAFQLACCEKGLCAIHIDTPVFTYRKHTGFRREENHKIKEQGVKAIVRKFGEGYWKGEKSMACGSCGSRRSSVPPASQQPLTMRSAAPSTDAVKMFNPAGGAAGVKYKAPSGHMYRFVGTSPQWVLSSDVEFFVSRGFLRHDTSGQDISGEQAIVAVKTGESKAAAAKK